MKAVDHHPPKLSGINTVILVRALNRRPIIIRNAKPNLTHHTISSTDRLVLGEPVVRAVEPHLRNTRVALDACGFLETLGNIVGDFAEDGDLALDDFLVPAGGHVAGDGVDETVARAVVEDFLP